MRGTATRALWHKRFASYSEPLARLANATHAHADPPTCTANWRATAPVSYAQTWGISAGTMQAAPAGIGWLPSHLNSGRFESSTLCTWSKVNARQRDEVHPAWPQELGDGQFSRSMSDDCVNLPGKSARSIADFAGAEQLYSSQPYPKLVEYRVCALDPGIAAGIVLM